MSIIVYTIHAQLFVIYMYLIVKDRQMKTHLTSFAEHTTPLNILIQIKLRTYKMQIFYQFDHATTKKII